MSAPAQVITEPPNPNGGPRTEEGKAVSSQNATTHGLFAATDFIRLGEREIYHDLADRLQTELAPMTMLEQNLADEIRRAMWRLRRCSLIEQSFADLGFTLDPMEHESTAKLQLSVDRARALSQRLLHKCTAELRKLQTERQFRNEYFVAGTDISYLGLANLASVMKGMDDSALADLRRKKLGNVVALDAYFKSPAPPPVSATPQTASTDVLQNELFAAAQQQPQTPRNAECPCGSGLKHKRCCGRNAPAVLHAA